MKNLKKLFLALMLFTVSIGYSQIETTISAPNTASVNDSILAISSSKKAKHITFSDLQTRILAGATHPEYTLSKTPTTNIFNLLKDLSIVTGLTFPDQEILIDGYWVDKKLNSYNESIEVGDQIRGNFASDNYIIANVLALPVTSKDNLALFLDNYLDDFSVSSFINLTSTSSLVSWSPSNITNLGTTLDWTVTGGVTIATTTIDDPTFDFSSNTGTANVLIENTDDLTIIHADNLDIVTVNLSEITSLLSLRFTNNSLISADISNLTLLQEAFFGNNSLTTFDITSNVNLIIVDCSDNILSTFDLSNNTSLTSVSCNDNSFSPSVTNQILADLVAMGFSGTLHYRNNETGQGVTDRAQLITNGSTITNYAN